MHRRTHGQTIVLVLALLLLVAGVAVGAWNEWTTQTCLAQEQPPGTDIDCEDALATLLRFSSVGLVVAGVGLLVVRRRQRLR